MASNFVYVRRVSGAGISGSATSARSLGLLGPFPRAPGAQTYQTRKRERETGRVRERKKQTMGHMTGDVRLLRERGLSQEAACRQGWNSIIEREWHQATQVINERTASICNTRHREKKHNIITIPSTIC